MSDSSRELASLENDVDRLRIAQARDVSTALAELRATEGIFSRVALLGKWWVDYPKATSQLLRVIERDPAIAVELAPTMLAADVLRDEYIDDILAVAFPDLEGPFREAALDRPGVRKRLKIGDHKPSVPPPDPAWLWPAGKPFPPADTVEGVQARLNYLDLGAGPVDGQWTDLTRRAFVRWQVLNGIEPSGELDYESSDRIGLNTPDAPE